MPRWTLVITAVRSRAAAAALLGLLMVSGLGRSQVQAQQMYLPIHNQVLNWGMKDGINFAVQPEDQPHFQFLTFN